MAEHDDRPDDGPAPDLPTGPRRPNRLTLVLLAVIGALLIAAPFTFAVLGTGSHRDPHLSDEPAAPTSIAGVPAPSGTPSASASPSRSRPAAPEAAHPTHRSPSPSATASRPATFTAQTGPECASSSSAAYRRVGSYYQGDMNGWLHTGSGCGQSDAIPMSGDADSADSGTYSMWQFHTGAVTSGRCAVSVQIIDKHDIRYVGGDPAHYTVYAAVSGGDPVGSFTVDQPGHLGEWVAAGSFPVDRAELRVVATDQGQDWDGSKKTYRHIAAGLLKVTCR